MDVKLEAYLLVIILVTIDQRSDAIGLSRDVYLLPWTSGLQQITISSKSSLSASSCKDRHSHTYTENTYLYFKVAGLCPESYQMRSAS